MVEKAVLLTPFDFGVVGGADVTGYANARDDTAAWQVFFDYCIVNRLPIVCTKHIISKITDTLTIAPVGNILIPYIGSGVSLEIDLGKVSFVYGGTRNRIALDIGSDSAQVRETRISLPAVYAYGAVSWMSVANLLNSPLNYIDDGIRLRNVHHCIIIEHEVYGWSRGIVYCGSSYNTIFGGQAIDNRFGRVWTTEGVAADNRSFTNENRVIGGRLGCSSNSNNSGDAYGDVFTWNKAASDRGQNNNRFYSVTYEMAFPETATYRVPVRMDGAGAICTWDAARQESNKGPFAICDGGLVSGAGSAYAVGNCFGISFNLSTSPQKRCVLQVNGAYGNIYDGPGAGEFHWNSGDIGGLVTSNGAAGVAYIGGPFAFLDAAGTAPAKTLAGGLAATARKAVHLVTAGVLVGIDTSTTKNFRLSASAPVGFVGRLAVLPFDASGTRLSGNAADATWGSEQYVKGYGLVSTNSFGGGYVSGADNQPADITITVREEVKWMWAGFLGFDAQLGLRGFSVVGYQTPDTVAGVNGYGGLRILPVFDDNGTIPLATAKPDTAGTHGYYQRGQRVANASAAAGVTTGWQVATSGWLAAAWGVSTAYPIVGRIVTNDSGKIYELKSAGTSAGSGGPTGTGSSISDGTCVWSYVGVKATFVTEAVSS